MAYSRLGGVLYLTYESAPISCFSKKDIAVSNSAMEAEIRAWDRTVRQIIIYRELLSELRSTKWTNWHTMAMSRRAWDESGVLFWTLSEGKRTFLYYEWLLIGIVQDSGERSVCRLESLIENNRQ